MLQNREIAFGADTPKVNYDSGAYLTFLSSLPVDIVLLTIKFFLVTFAKTSYGGTWHQ